METPSIHDVRHAETAWRTGVSRWSAALFLVMAVAGTIMSMTPSPYASSVDSYVDYYRDLPTTIQPGVFLVMLSLIPLLWALVRLQGVFTSPLDRLSPRAVMPAGLLLAAAIAGIDVTGRGVGSAVEITPGFTLTQETAQTAVVLTFVQDGFIMMAAVSCAVLAWAVALAGRQTGLLPGWMVWVGFVLAPMQPFAWVLFEVPMVVFLAWFAIVVAIVPREP